ncbi:MAG TPA: hypothetical protein PLN32_07120 [Methanoregulaceae archaeon]|nr:hypothetical protein [Methanoregulaceae archaeon]
MVARHSALVQRGFIAARKIVHSPVGFIYDTLLREWRSGSLEWWFSPKTG